MRRFKVTVNGRQYDVNVEEVTEARINSDSSHTAQNDSVLSTRVSTDNVGENVDGTAIKAPLTGAIVSVAVAVGDKVAQGQLLVQIEALKLTNEVVSPVGGTVKAVKVKPGQQVSSGTPMIIIG